MEKPKVLILGAGYAGLKAAKILQRVHDQADITLVNKNDYHYESISLHEVAAGTRAAQKIEIPLDHVIDFKKVRFIQDEVIKVQTEQKTVLLRENAPLSYDYLVLALGFESESFGITGVDEYTLPLQDIPSAEAIKQHVEERLTAFKTSQDPADSTIIVCGAGFTSIEYLGELTNHIHQLQKNGDFPQPKLVCIEAMATILPMFPPELSAYAVDKLEKRGVTFLTNAPIQKITAGCVHYKQGDQEHSLAGNSIIWTTGVKGSHVIGESGLPEKRNRLMVEADLSLKDDPSVFVIGDVSAVINPATNAPYPPTAQISLKQGECAAKNIERRLKGESTQAFHFESAGTVCSLGDNQAIGIVGKKGYKFKGYPASFLKKAIADKSIMDVANFGQVLKVGRFDFYH